VCLGRKRVGARPEVNFFAGGWDRIEGPTGALNVTADLPSRPRAESAGSSPLPTRPAQPRGGSAFRFREVLPTAREVSSRAAGTAGLLPGPTERVIIMPARLKHGQPDQKGWLYEAVEFLQVQEHTRLCGTARNR
jgi:hypothetical protein